MLFKSIPDSTKPFQFLAIEGYLQPAMIENVIAMSGSARRLKWLLNSRGNPNQQLVIQQININDDNCIAYSMHRHRVVGIGPNLNGVGIGPNLNGTFRAFTCSLKNQSRLFCISYCIIESIEVIRACLVCEI